MDSIFHINRAININKYRRINMKGIYKIYNKITEKYYIGSTNSLNMRWKYHLRYLKQNKHWNIHLQRSFNKYGIDKFEFIILEVMPHTVNEIDLLNTEQKWLDTVFLEDKDNVYNICKISGKPPSRSGSHYIMSEEHKRKLALQRGWHHTDETKHRLSILQKGRKNEKAVKAMIKAWKGKKHSEESKLKMSLSRKGKPCLKLRGRIISDKCKMINRLRCSKEVNQICKKTGKIIKKYNCAKDAEIELIGKKSGAISAVCLGKQKSAHGFKWEYINKKVV